VSHTALAVAPAERFDVIVDFSAYPVGTEVTLLNTLQTGATGQIRSCDSASRDAAATTARCRTS
jgi:FtsP/CotA-like multicopper oxidase with cupredoxin domain